MPTTRDTDDARHFVKLGVGIGDHVAHDHPAELGAHVIDIDGHVRAIKQTERIAQHSQ